MALMRGKEIPSGAVKLDEIEATEYIWNIVSEWENSSDVWALRYASFVLGGINAFSGIWINRFYRQKLKLGTYGYFASVLPISAMPGILTALFHRHLVSTDMLLMKSSYCPTCYEVKSGAIQIGLGLAYPMILGPLSAFMMANRYSTARIPDILDGPKEMFKYLRKITRPFTTTLTVIAVGQLVASSVLTYFEMKNHLILKHKLTEIEARIEAEQFR